MYHFTVWNNNEIIVSHFFSEIELDMIKCCCTTTDSNEYEDVYQDLIDMFDEDVAYYTGMLTDYGVFMNEENEPIDFSNKIEFIYHGTRFSLKAV